ncbi:response regulator [Nannocystis bainbridge]|uniref:Response regulator n=1 Tax=Nannocystis bainbridge TaxID=2995303 RepID=A0ABT5DUQ1_9BACT|nr:response regulator [Nannocystis bainbridge]MDC0716863.1 response regulator [Nannocystis bainbridge]
MTSLLIVEDDTHFRGELARELEGHGFQVDSAPSVHSALSALARRPADVVLTDLRLGGPDGLDLLKLLPSVSRKTRPILMSAHASAREHQVATELGAVDFLLKPFTPTELLRSIHKAIDCETGFVGSVHGLSLIDVAQMFHMSQRSVTILVGAAGRPASKIHFRRGEIVGASYGDQVGCPALRAILAASTGALHTTGLEEGVVQTIDAPFDHLLLACLSRLDEELHDRRGPQETPAVFELGDFGESDELAATADEVTDDSFLAAPTLVTSPAQLAARAALDDVCRRLTGVIDGALACAVAVVDSGVLLGHHRRGAAAPTSETAMTAVARELFGGGVGRLAGGLLHEIQLTATDHHIFGKLLADRRRALVLVTDRSVSIGMGWAQLRANIGAFERVTG